MFNVTEELHRKPAQILSHLCGKAWSP